MKPSPALNTQQIACVCHDANASFCHTIGDHSQKTWPDAEEWQRASAIRGVEYALANPDAPASAQHEAWLKDKLADGWEYGLVKNAVAKTHPCILPYAELPQEQRVKDYLFKAIVKAFVAAAGE